MHNYIFLRFISVVIVIGGKFVWRKKSYLTKYLCHFIRLSKCHFILISLSVVNCCSSKSSSDKETSVVEPEGVGFRIVSGDDAIPGEFPYQVCNANADFGNIFNNFLIHL